MKLKIAFASLLCALFASCAFEAAIPKYHGRAALPPELTGVRSVSGEELRFEFSEAVKVRSLVLEPAAEIADIVAEGNEVAVLLAAPYNVGEKVSADIVVENAAGNTLEAVFTFTAFNNLMPKVAINELRTEQSKPRVEFIEFKVLDVPTGAAKGNLAGLKLFIASNGIDEAVYEFPSCEVAKGEYVVLHLRSPDYMNAVDELDGNTNLADAKSDAGLTPTQAKNAKNDCAGRDLWMSGSSKKLRKTDIVYITDQQNTVLSAVAFCDKAKESAKWEGSKNFEDALDLLAESGAWSVTGNTLDCAVDSGGISVTNTLCRDESKGEALSKGAWGKIGSGKASPGGANTIVP